MDPPGAFPNLKYTPGSSGVMMACCDTVRRGVGGCIRMIKAFGNAKRRSFSIGKCSGNAVILKDLRKGGRSPPFLCAVENLRSFKQPFLSVFSMDGL